MKGLDLAKFKKISSDDKTTTLQHDKGHELRIAHSGLSPKLKSQLDGLPIHMAKGGKVQRFADGTNEPVQPQPTDAPGDETDNKGHTTNIYVGQPQPAQAQQVAQNSQVPNIAAPVPLDNQSPEQATPAQPAAPTPADQDPNQTEPVSQEAQDAMPDNDSTAPTAQPPDKIPTTPQAFQDMRRNATLAEGQQYFADQQAGHITPMTYQSMFAKKDTLGKIGTIFGLMLSGAGSGLAHQPNALLEMMNKTIDNDFKAQTESATNAQNAVRLNQQHQLQQAQIPKLMAEKKLTEAQAKVALADADLKAKTNARIQMNWNAFHDLTLQNSKLPPGSPQKQQSDQMLALLYNGVNSENFNIADRAAAASALLHFGPTGGQQVAGNESTFQQNDKALRLSGNDKLAEDMEAKHMPGFAGQASVPLGGQDREYLNSGVTFQKQLGNFMDWTAKHSGDISPSDRKHGMALAADLQGAYRQATHGGVYKEGEANFISKLIDSTPTKFFNSIRVMPSLKAISDDNQQRVGQYAKSLGFSGFDTGTHGGQQPSKTMAIKDGATGTYNGKPVVRKNGKWVPAG